MEYPSKTDAPEEKEEKKQAKWTKTQDPDVSDKSATATPTPAYVISSKKINNDFRRKQSNEKAPEAPTEAPKAKPESEEEEESEDEGEIIRKPRTSMIIGFRTIKNAGTGRRYQKQNFILRRPTKRSSNRGNQAPNQALSRNKRSSKNSTQG